MSYEGYVQALCEENAHLFTYDPSYMGYEKEDHLCPHCKSKPCWSNGVDQTNCDDYGIIPGFEWKKLQITPDVYEECNLGHLHLVKPATYNVPTQEQEEQLEYCLDAGENYGIYIRLFDGKKFSLNGEPL